MRFLGYTLEKDWRGEGRVGHVASMAFPLCLIWTWWCLFPTVARAFALRGGFSGIAVGSVNELLCLACCAGLLAGVIAMGVFPALVGSIGLGDRVSVVGYVVFVLCGLAFYGSLGVLRSFAAACLCLIPICAYGAVELILLVVTLGRFDARVAVLCVAACVLGSAAAQSALGLMLDAGAPLGVVATAHMVLLVANIIWWSLGLIGHYGLRFSFDEVEAAKDAAGFPVAAAVHLGCYSFALSAVACLCSSGFEGALGGMPAAVGSALGAIGVLALERASAKRVVAPSLVVRKAVYPLAAGPALLSLLLEPGLSRVILAGVVVLYVAVVARLALTMMRQTWIPPFRIVSKGALWLCLGASAGVVCGFAAHDIWGAAPARLVVCCVLWAALTVGTFWIGSDSSLRKWWGAGKNLTPKRFGDQLIDRKCDHLAEKFGLSAREREVLGLMARGRRPAQIKEDLFISVSTVRNHVHNVYGKLGVHSSKELDALLRAVPVEVLDMDGRDDLYGL